MSAPTCGTHYLKLLKVFTELDPERVRYFAAGFVCGQAEKIHLGACPAAMFRPNSATDGDETRCIPRPDSRRE